MLENINSPRDLKALDRSVLIPLADEIREIIIETVKERGGHLASNLGTVEATIALHRVFDSPDDSILFDVGHQCYTHKLLTGRYNGFGSLRGFGGISGFTNRDESDYDVLTAGHSGSSLPAALGIAKANAIEGKDSWVVCVIGDGSFTNGMIYEALNNCSTEGLKLIIVLNDNQMSISQNVGGISSHFRRLRNSKRYFNFKHRFQKRVRKIPLVGEPLVKGAYKTKEFFKKIIFGTNLFEAMGLYYMGPFDGNDEFKMELVLNEAKTKESCTLVHMVTKKGKGYEAAEKEPDVYHFAGKVGAKPESKSFSSVFGEYITERAESNDNICAVTAAMDKGTGLYLFKKRFPDRFTDVGIAEECAVTYSAGLAIGGKLPVLSLYSTFLQRSFDQVLEDVALQGVHMILAVDRAGLVTGDGVTHQGIWDVSLLRSIPGTYIYSPETTDELISALKTAEEGTGLYCIRYPKGGETDYDRSGFENKGPISVCGSGKIVIITYGRVTANAFEAVKRSGLDCKIVKLYQLNPLPKEELLEEIKSAEMVYVLEEGVREGGIASAVSALVSENRINVSLHIRAIEGFIPHGYVDELEKYCGIDAESVKNELLVLTENL